MTLVNLTISLSGYLTTPTVITTTCHVTGIYLHDSMEACTISSVVR